MKNTAFYIIRAYIKIDKYISEAEVTTLRYKDALLEYSKTCKYAKRNKEVYRVIVLRRLWNNDVAQVIKEYTKKTKIINSTPYGIIKKLCTTKNMKK